MQVRRGKVSRNLKTRALKLSVSYSYARLDLTRILVNIVMGPHLDFYSL